MTRLLFHGARGRPYLMLLCGAALVCAASLGGCGSSADPGETEEVHPPPAGSIRLLTLGNSITQADAEHLSYRYALWRRLVDAGIAVDFVGSQRGHFGGTPSYPQHANQDFDRDHEGHWGWRVDEILDGQGSGGLRLWLADYDPDLVLMHLGTNDVFAGQATASTLDELREVIRQLRSDVPGVAIFWALLLPTADAGTTTAIAELNAAVSSLALELDSAESPIVLVDLNTGFDAATLTYDGVHPTQAGEEWMAERWFAAIQATLPSGGTGS